MLKRIASECYSALFPKNSLNGFNYCLQQQVDGIEFDVHLSRDGHIVIQHDYQLNPRITRDDQGRWLTARGPALRQLKLDEIKRYDIGRYCEGSHEQQHYAHYQPQDGERIPTLDEFLTSHQINKSNCELWIELKTTPYDRQHSSDAQQLLDKVLQSLVAYKVINKTVLLAFEWDLLAQAQQRYPQLQTNWLTINPEYIIASNKKFGAIDPDLIFGAHRPKTSIAQAIASAGGSWWGPYVGDVQQDALQQAQQLGVKVNVWGVETNQLDHVIALAPDAITLADPLQQIELNTA